MFRLRFDPTSERGWLLRLLCSWWWFLCVRFISLNFIRSLPTPIGRSTLKYTRTKLIKFCIRQHFQLNLTKASLSSISSTWAKSIRAADEMHLCIILMCAQYNSFGIRDEQKKKKNRPTFLYIMSKWREFFFVHHRFLYTYFSHFYFIFFPGFAVSVLCVHSIFFFVIVCSVARSCDRIRRVWVSVDVFHFVCWWMIVISVVWRQTRAQHFSLYREMADCYDALCVCTFLF